MQNKLIALNSGGFDSVVMINELVSMGYEVISLFFDWGQPNYSQESFCANKLSNKLGIEHLEVKLNMPWVNTNMEDKVYIPMRNLIFTSYALSLAEQRGIKDVYLAIIKNSEDAPFFDCSQDFYDGINMLMDETDIIVHTPFIDYNKYNLSCLINKHNITMEDFFSCNTPTEEGKPCRSCGDCLAINYMMSNVTYKETKQEFINKGVTDRFKTLFIQAPYQTVKLYINNSCNMRCQHCFLNDVELYGELLSEECIFNLIDEVAKEGIPNIDFFGKEVLFNDTIFKYLDYMEDNYPEMSATLITNGLNLSKYAERLAKYTILTDIALSMESLGEVTSRTSPSSRALEVGLKYNLPISVTIDLLNSNYMEVKPMVDMLKEMGVKYIYIKPIIPVASTDVSEATKPEILVECIKSLAFEDHKDTTVEFGIKFAHTYLLQQDPFFKEVFTKSINNESKFENVYLVLEHYCEAFNQSITIMADGEVVGCGYEINKNYKQYSIGNIKKQPLDAILTKGKNVGVKINEQNEKKGCVGCFHSPNFYYKK